MRRTSRDIVTFALGLAVLLGLAFGGYAVVRARAEGGTPRQALAVVDVPSPASSAPLAPQYQRWTVGKALGPVVVLARPLPGARVRARLQERTPQSYPTLVLVRAVREVAGVTWYRVSIAVRPNGSSGWVREGQLAFYTTSAKIVIDLSARRLAVYRRGEKVGSYPVAVGRPGLETPTGLYFVNQKLRPPSPGGPYGVLALGISAFQPALSSWPQGGPVAIHGTNRDDLIGQAVSHGCVRMHDADVLAVSRSVPAGSPVVIQK
ncbi:MAG: L,D-transpeptidase [Thermoleophilia bacterium]